MKQKSAPPKAKSAAKKQGQPLPAGKVAKKSVPAPAAGASGKHKAAKPSPSSGEDDAEAARFGVKTHSFQFGDEDEDEDMDADAGAAELEGDDDDAGSGAEEDDELLHARLDGEASSSDGEAAVPKPQQQKQRSNPAAAAAHPAVKLGALKAAPAARAAASAVAAPAPATKSAAAAVAVRGAKPASSGARPSGPQSRAAAVEEEDDDDDEEDDDYEGEEGDDNDDDDDDDDEEEGEEEEEDGYGTGKATSMPGLGSSDEEDSDDEDAAGGGIDELLPRKRARGGAAAAGEDDDEEDDDDEEEDADFEREGGDLEAAQKRLSAITQRAARDNAEEMRLNLAGRGDASGNELFELPTPEELEAERSAPPPLTALRRRVNDVVGVLTDFRVRRDPARSRREYVEVLTQDCADYYGYDRGLVELFLELFSPTEAISFLEANETPRPVVIRVNTLKTTRRELAQSLVNRGARLDPVGAWSKLGLKVYESPVPVGATPEYLAGHYMLQSASSFVPVMALGARPGERILDMCAAPGGKTTHIAQCMENRGVLVANDVKKERLPSLYANLSRLGITCAAVSCMDGRLIPGAMKGFDRILLDAPCTGLGVISRDPSIKTQKGRDDVTRQSHLQKQLILAAVDALDACPNGPGGILVYSTCSVAVEENEAVVNYLLRKRHVKLLPLFEEGQEDIGRKGLTAHTHGAFHPSLSLTRRYYPHEHNMDGFFVAKIKKLSNALPGGGEAGGAGAAGKTRAAAGGEDEEVVGGEEEEDDEDGDEEKDGSEEEEEEGSDGEEEEEEEAPQPKQKQQRSLPPSSSGAAKVPARSAPAPAPTPAAPAAGKRKRLPTETATPQERAMQTEAALAAVVASASSTGRSPGAAAGAKKKGAAPDAGSSSAPADKRAKGSDKSQQQKQQPSAADAASAAAAAVAAGKPPAAAPGGTGPGGKASRAAQWKAKKAAAAAEEASNLESGAVVSFLRPGEDKTLGKKKRKAGRRVAEAKAARRDTKKGGKRAGSEALPEGFEGGEDGDE